jgi:RNA polymerase sigma-70 factor (ECF subfamily)
MEINESQIIANCQKGQLDNFAQLYDSYIKKIYNFLYYRTHHKETAEDLASLAFTKALEKIATFNPNKGKFSTWLYQIARHCLVDHYRSVVTTSDINDAWDLPSNANTERDANIAISMDKLKSYLHSLPARQRDIILMRVWDGLSHKEISEILGVSEANSKVAFSRAIEKIRTEAGISLLVYLLIGAKLF